MIFMILWGLRTGPTFKISNYTDEIFIDIYLVSCLSPLLKAPLGIKCAGNIILLSNSYYPFIQIFASDGEMFGSLISIGTSGNRSKKIF